LFKGVGTWYVAVIGASGHTGIELLRLPADSYEEWYGKSPVAEEHQQLAVYGFSEWYAHEIQHGRVLANPGCYPTATLLALSPLTKEGAIDTGSVIIDATSGVSGAGRNLVTAADD
jgi:N-acetyl-gamma-glutamyl-phosphate reductase